mgnify:CR=1 FL=1
MNNINTAQFNNLVVYTLLHLLMAYQLYGIV